MSAVTYKGIEIRTFDHDGSAFATIGGKQRCFLGGLSEAKRFVREAALPPPSGPRDATWEVRWSDAAPYACSMYASRNAAIAELRYYQGHNRDAQPTVTRTDLCRYPGCDGRGEVAERTRGIMVKHRPCPHHEEPSEHYEGSWDLLFEARHCGLKITVKPNTRRHVAGGECVDVVFHDVHHPGSRMEATVNWANVEWPKP